MPSKKGLEKYILLRRTEVKLDDIRPDPENIRDRYPRAGLIVLAHSLAQRGQLQAALFENDGGRTYDIVAGHRRYWASRLAYESGWTHRDYMIAKVVSPLPKELRLRVQMAENECKAPLPKDNLANVLWTRYKPAVIDRLTDISEEEKQAILLAKDLSEIPLEYRKVLTISEYAREMGIGEDVVRRAFAFQELNTDLRRQVSDRDNPLSYMAAVEAARIEDRNIQRVIIGNVRNSGEVTSRRVREAVNRYLEETRKQEESGSFLVMEGPNLSRKGSLVDLSDSIGQAEHYLKVLDAIDHLVLGFLDRQIRTNGKAISTSEILTKAYDEVLKYHGELLKDETYKRRWEFVPRRNTLEEFVTKNGSDKASINGVEGLVESKDIDISLIDPNPHNPRGSYNDFDSKSLEKLADSIDREGLIQDVLLMKNGRRYLNLEGHRRLEALKILKKRGLRNTVGALIVPSLTEEQQIKIMCDSDLFEDISKDARARSLARQYELERNASKEELTIDEFARRHKEWSARTIRDAVAYSSLPREIQEMHTNGIMPYGTALVFSSIEDKDVQLDVAISAAIRGLKREDILRMLEEEKDSASLLFDKKALADFTREQELKRLALKIEESLFGTSGRVKDIVVREELKKRFLKDDYLMHKFQRFMKLLEGMVKD